MTDASETAIHPQRKPEERRSLDELKAKHAGCAHRQPVYLVGNTYCDDCGLWLHSGPLDDADKAAASAVAEKTALPPTPDEIDTEIAFYNQALACAKQAQEDANKYRDRLVELADKFGARPAHAEQSVRLAGRRNTVTVTRGTTVTINEPAVADLETYLGNLGSGIFERLFATQTKHTLIEGARDLLKKLSLPRRTEEKVLSLFGRCIDLKTKAPTVKVELVKPEKPVRKPRAKKVAA